LKSVTVLMSTYNGEKYISTQIESILKQKSVHIQLFIRDDGSTDNTVRILEKYKKSSDNITILCGINIGWRQSYSSLVMQSGDSDYYAFADQDDYWYEDKLITAIKALNDHDDIPCLYRGRSEIADGELHPSGVIFNNTPLISCTRSLFQNYCQGCTLVFNRCLRDRYRLAPIENVSHDVWLPLIALHTGIIVDDATPHMLYRVHDSNATAGKSLFATLRKWIKVIKKDSDSNYHFNYGEVLYGKMREYLKPESTEICKKMSEYRESTITRFKLLFDTEVRGNTILRTLLVKYFIITKSYRSNI
jgi:glycosyltransferase involved in cell wall biosynthesis